MTKEQLYELTLTTKDDEFTVEDKVLGWTIHHGRCIVIEYANGEIQVFELGQSKNEKAFFFTPVKE